MLEVSCLGGKTSERVVSSTYLCTGQPVDKSLISTKNDWSEPGALWHSSTEFLPRRYELVSTNSLSSIG